MFEFFRRLRGWASGLNAISARFDLIQSRLDVLTATIEQIGVDLQRTGKTADQPCEHNKSAESDGDQRSAEHQHDPEQLERVIVRALGDASNKKIKVGFFVIYASGFPCRRLFELMVADGRFDPFIIVAPDIMRGVPNMLAQLDLTANYFLDFSDRVLKGYEGESGQFVDYSETLDFACVCNPYEEMTHEFFKSMYLASRNIKTFFVHYSYSVTNFDKKSFAMPHFRKFWKIFISNPLFADELRWDGIPTDNFDVVGYPKLDRLMNIPGKKKSGKMIILAPHHTFNYDELKLSSFSAFSNIYWELPSRFPEAQFVFRPHPLFIVNLKKILKWTEADVDSYLNKILQNTNVSYDTEPDYMDLFNDSDALIHDCGSFIAEYLYTTKPCCYLMREKDVFRELNFVGKKCLDLHYQAYSYEDVYDFVERVVIGEDDRLQQLRLAESNAFVKINHPNSSRTILDRIVAETVPMA